MRKLISLFILSLLASTVYSQTSAEIYNYITKGYVTTISQGLDMKKGYAFEELMVGDEFTGTLSANTYQFSYRKFYEEKKPGTTAAHMIVLTKNGQFDKAFCLPVAGSDPSMYGLFWKDITLRLYADQKEKLLFELAVLFTAYYKTAEEK